MSGSVEILVNPDAETCEALEERLAALRKLGASANTDVRDHAFQTGLVLISHKNKAYVQEGLALMERVAAQAFSELSGFQDNKQQEQEQEATMTNKTQTNQEKLRKDLTEQLRAGYFLLGIANYKIGNYSNARSSVERMLEMSPHNPQGIALRDRIDEKVISDAVTGGVVVAALAGVAALGWRLLKK